MRRTKDIDINGTRVTVHELTTGDIRAWMADSENAITSGKEMDLVDLFLLDQCELTDLTRMSNLGVDDMDRLTPGELQVVLDAAREVNEGFFQMRARILAASEQLPKSLSAPSAA